MASVVDNLKSFYDGLPQWARLAMGGVALAVPSIYYIFSKKSRKFPIKDDWKPGVVYLYQFPRVNYIPNLSPFCLKLETWLRMANINYENVPIDFFSVRSKEGMLPFIELNGVEYDDSSLIMDTLPSKLSGKDTDDHLDKEQRAAARAFEQMAENSTMPSYAYFRYTEFIDELLSEKVLGMPLPLFFRIIPFATWSISRSVKTKLYHHGIGRHSPEDILKIGEKDLMAINDFLSDKKFLMGSKPARVDATLFSMLSAIIYLPLDTPHKKYIMQNCPKLVEHTDRMKTTFWPDWEETIKTKKMDTKWKQ